MYLHVNLTSKEKSINVEKKVLKYFMKVLTNYLCGISIEQLQLLFWRARPNTQHIHKIVLSSLHSWKIYI